MKHLGTLLADGLVALAGFVARQVDPSVLDVHLTRAYRPFGLSLDLAVPAPSNPCRPRELVSGYDALV